MQDLRLDMNELDSLSFQLVTFDLYEHEKSTIFHVWLEF